MVSCIKQSKYLWVCVHGTEGEAIMIFTDNLITDHANGPIHAETFGNGGLPLYRYNRNIKRNPPDSFTAAKDGYSCKFILNITRNVSRGHGCPH